MVTRGAETQSAWTAGSGPSESLKPFTTTAEVPAVGHEALADTGSVPAVHRRRPAPLVLRVALWTTIVLLVVGGAGLVVHRVRPGWLRHLEPASVARSTGQGATTGRQAAAANTASASALVRQSASGPASADLIVSGSPFTVVVTAQGTAWIQVTTPSSVTPKFSSFLVAGTQRSFSSVDGQLALMIGAAKVSVAVEVGGNLTQWQFTSTTVPYGLSFKSGPT